jgi:hypothetical protein
VDTSDRVEIYPADPRPWIVEVRDAPPAFSKRYAVVDTKEAVET